MKETATLRKYNKCKREMLKIEEDIFQNNFTLSLYSCVGRVVTRHRNISNEGCNFKKGIVRCSDYKVCGSIYMYLLSPSL